MDFASLPDRVLAQILGYEVSSFAVISLWKAGNKKLMYKLAHSCERVILKDDSKGSTSRWPKMLTELRQLRELTIKRSFGYLMSPIPLSFELLKLPPTLKKLNIDCFEIINAFWNFDRFKLPDGTLQPIDMSKVDILELALRDISLVWPRLETFKINSLKAGSFLQPSIVTVLPQSLTELSLFTTMEQEILDALPPSLTSISASRFRDVSKWPPLITELNVISVTPRSALQTLRSLPKSLKGSIHDLEVITFNKSLAEALPPSLEDLHISQYIDTSSFEESINGPWTKAFPPALKTLKLSPSLMLLDVAHIASLPRTLTSLKGLLADYLNIHDYATQGDDKSAYKLNLDLWPPNLQTLCLSGRISISSLVLPCLPVTLRHLEFSAPSSIDSHLPPLLTTLKIYNSATVTFELPFPPNLTHLYLEGDIDYVPNSPWPSSLLTIENPFNSSSVLDFERVILDRAPSTLQSLTMRSITKLWKSLPPSLTSFISSVSGPPPDMEDFASLPTTLLIIGANFKQNHGLLDENTLARLPKNLTRLRIHNCYFTSRILPLLPRRLRFLDVVIISFDIDSIKKMPDCIEECKLTELAPTPENEELINALPDSLFMTPSPYKFLRTANTDRRAAQYPDHRVTARYATH